MLHWTLYCDPEEGSVYAYEACEVGQPSAEVDDETVELENVGVLAVFDETVFVVAAVLARPDETDVFIELAWLAEPDDVSWLRLGLVDDKVLDGRAELSMLL